MPAGPPSDGAVRITLPGLPHGVIARAVLLPDGRVPRDRSGRLHPRSVDLSAMEARVASAVPSWMDRDVDWLLAAPQRRWASIDGRFGSQAVTTCMRLVREGAVTVRARVVDADLGPIIGWSLTPSLAELAHKRGEARTSDTEQWRTRACAVAPLVVEFDTDLADLLEQQERFDGVIGPLLVLAGEDLVAGMCHDGPRAFSAAHFGSTKARDDAPRLLAAAGVGRATLAALGIARAPYVGFGGPVTVQGCDLAKVAGPVQFRADQPGGLAITTHGAAPVVVVENLQAAETVCDDRPDVAVVWCAGQPARSVLTAIGVLAVRSPLVLIAADADLGGVRIASRIASAVVGVENLHVLDAGVAPHATTRRFSARVERDLDRVADRSDPAVAAFARAVQARGYGVEQERSIRAVLRTALSTHAPDRSGGS